MTPEELAEIAFEAYYNARYVSGNILKWSGAPEADKAAWIAAAQAVKKADNVGPVEEAERSLKL